MNKLEKKGPGGDLWELAGASGKLVEASGGSAQKRQKHLQINVTKWETNGRSSKQMKKLEKHLKQIETKEGTSSGKFEQVENVRHL